MRRRVWTASVALVAVGVLQSGGCAPLSVQVPVDFVLGAGLKSIDLVDGQGETTGTGTFADTDQGTVLGGTVRLDPAAISISNPTATAKGYTTYQLAEVCTGEPLVVTVWVAAFDLVDTVFDDGEQYGPFELTLDADCVPVSVSPSSVTLTPATIALIDGGSFSIGIRAQSPVDGTLVINNLSFNLSVGF